MAATRYDFTGSASMEQGALFEREFTLTNADGSPMNLAGFKVRMQARENYDSPAAAVTFDSEPPTSNVIIAGNKFTLKMNDANTSLVPAGLFVYDIEVENPAGDVQRMFYGKFRCSPEVTKI